MFDEYQELIKDAETRVYRVAKHTALDYLPLLSERHSNKIWLKREDQQPVFSYKLRGAYNMIASLTDAQRARGIITASAGNHAQGVALACQQLKAKATVIMPKTTPQIKITAVERMQAQVVLHGNNYDDAKGHALEQAESTQMCYIPPYDHPLIIAGQATVGVEMLAQARKPLDVIFVPVGGGGLIAGIAVHLKAQQPNIKIIGVEPDEAACMYEAFTQGKRVILEKIGIFADGAAVRQAGAENYRIAKSLVDELILVSIDDICAAIKDIFEEIRVIAEPAGALALAGLKKFVAAKNLQNQNLSAILSGANVNFDRLRHIAELSSLGANCEALFGITIPEKPGSFRELCHALGPRSITEFNYRYAHHNTAHVFVGVQLKQGIDEKNALLEQLSTKGYTVEDLSDNDLAKLHIRYMVGGYGDKLKDEVIYRFEFPERPGALLYFLTQMAGQWNISLFHYRNHGAAYGRVLIGFQVQAEERDAFAKFISERGIAYKDESANQAYNLFLT